MSAKAALMRGSLTTERSVDGSASSGVLAAGDSLAAEDGFHTGEELVEVVGCFAVSLDSFATAHRAMPDMRFKLTRECFAFHRLDFLLVF